ncbi:MAG: hypothetical protein VX642_15440 [Bdellovibrionota bacterium]|nr:hypothetical protein [Bdellovibrionota bacterium]
MDHQPIFWYLDSHAAKKLKNSDLRSYLGKATELAEECINQSLESGGSSLNINLILQTPKKLSDDFLETQTATEYLPFETEDKSFFNGIEPLDRSLYVFFQSKKKGMHFVPQYSDSKFQSLKKEVSKIKPEIFESVEALTDFFSEKEMFSMDPKLEEFALAFFDRINKEDFQNTVYLSSEALLSSPGNQADIARKFVMANLAATLAHEILHSWGNLQDSYYDDKEDLDENAVSQIKYSDTSLMSYVLRENASEQNSIDDINENSDTNNTLLDLMNCRLTEAQVRAVENYRAKVKNSKRSEGGLCQSCLDSMQ